MNLIDSMASILIQERRNSRKSTGNTANNTPEQEQTSNMVDIDTSNMCSHLQKKLFEPEGVYYHILQALIEEPTHTGDSGILHN